jgi:hypothetical protein
MTLDEVLKVVAAVGTVVTGLVSLFWPKSIRGFTGLNATGPRGITEIRAVFGGFFLALGITPLVVGASEMYWMLGIAYLAVAAVRAVSMLTDKSVERSNIISLAVEVVFGAVLVL